MLWYDINMFVQAVLSMGWNYGTWYTEFENTIRPQFLFLGLQIFTVMSNIGGREKIKNVLLLCQTQDGLKRDKRDEGERVNQGQLLLFL